METFCTSAVPLRTWFFPSTQESHTHNTVITLLHVSRGRVKGFYGQKDLEALEGSLSSSSSSSGDREQLADR